MAEIIEKKKRKYFSEKFSIEKWAELEEVLKDMLSAQILSAQELVSFIEKYGELSSLIEEQEAWKIIRTTQYADKPEFAKEQADFYEFIVAPAQPYFFELDKKIYNNAFFKQLPEKKYAHLRKLLKNEIEIFREENVSLMIKENELANKYGEISSKLTVKFEGKERTLEEMDLILQEQDRSRREAAWREIWKKVTENRDELEKLFDDLKSVRLKIASNAGFNSYAEYAYKALGKLDYTIEDSCGFHDSIKEVVVPAIREINEQRKKALKIDVLRPWDMFVDLEGAALQPFSDAKDLLAGSLRILQRIDLDFYEEINLLSENGFLDLDNRKGKAPGGYNCSLSETGASFIFMNAVGRHLDVQTFLHESGHALHASAIKDEPIVQYRNPPHEISEVASMSMEFFILDYLDEFYQNNQDVIKAKKEHLESALMVFPNVAVIDAFQNWIYSNPECSKEERGKKFAELKEEYNAGVDWSGLETEKEIGWLRVMHIFEVPFYYLEYAICQLGAISLYKKFKENPARAIENYKKFMKIGYSKSVPEVYAVAGIKFDFSKQYVEEMVDFIMKELRELK